MTLKSKSPTASTRKLSVTEIFFPFQGLHCKVLSGSDTDLIWVGAGNVATQILPCRAVPPKTTRSSLPFLVSLLSSNSSTALGFFLYSHPSNLHVEIVAHFIENGCVETGNARFGKWFASTSMGLGPILQTAITLNLTAVHNIWKIKPCTARASRSREISFVFITFAKEL